MLESLAFGPDGTTYVTGGQAGDSINVYTLDLTTGPLSPVTTTGIDIDALTYASDGYLYGTDSMLAVADLIRIDPNTGDVLNLGNTGVTGFNGITAIRAVPEPSVLASFVICLAGLAAVRRGKKH